jgi:Cu/Ag efflux pump CusA
MWIVRLALSRPYTFVVTALVLVLLTPFVLLRTPTDIFPSIDIPVVSAVWIYNGLSAQEIEQRILYNHERMITALVDNIEHIESTAYNGAGVIKVFLRPGTSVETGIAQITATGQAILRQLPPGITPPIIVRYNASTVPILQYSLASKKFSEQELQDMAFNQVRVGLANVRGAAIPFPYGGKQRVVAVDLDLAALKAKNLAPIDVVNALNAQNLILPGGTAKIGATEYDISLNSSPDVLDKLNDLPIKTVNGAVIRVLFRSARGRARDQGRHAPRAERIAAGVEREGILGPIRVRPRRRKRRGEGRRDCRRADRSHGVALSGRLAEHAHHRDFDPSLGACIACRAQRPGRNDQSDDARRSGAGRWHSGR